ncbi:hypothetical protein, partial [Escherichia coli]|uniref:hypothetical protein n=2 Tax=Escherichia coli TaxID=562 RepID=UPI001F3FD349
WKGWAILLRQKQKKLIMLPSETMIWQPEFTDKTLSRKPGAVQCFLFMRVTLVCYPDITLRLELQLELVENQRPNPRQMEKENEQYHQE